MEFDIHDNNNSSLLAFDSPKDQSAYIKVIGVGGGGGNAVNHMYKQGIQGVDFIICNTDRKALNSSPVTNKIELGNQGLGAGNKPERARQYAEEKADQIRDIISHNTQMLFITAGMGGGTGTGAAPVIAKIAKSIELEDENTKHILVVAIVTMPFNFEGRQRKLQAEEGIAELRKYADSVLIINNDKLRQFGDLTLSNAFVKADDVLLTAAKGIAEIITVSDYVNIDFQDVNTVMENSGTALMGDGIGEGENRALDAITAASTSVLLNDNEISGAQNVLLYFSYSDAHQITMDEMNEITDYITNLTGESNFIWGAGANEDLGEKLRVTLIATGFGQNTNQTPTRHELPTAEMPSRTESKPVAPQVEAPIANGEMYVKHSDTAVESPAVAQPIAPEPISVAPIHVEPIQVPAPQPEAHHHNNTVAPTSQSEPVATNIESKTNVESMMHAMETLDEAPMAVVHSAPVPTVGQRFTLDSPEPQQADDPTVAVAEIEAPKAEDEGIHLVDTRAQQQPAMVAQPMAQANPAPAPQVAPVHFAPQHTGSNSGMNDDEVARKRAERLKRMNELLHSDPAKVESMTPAQLSTDAIYETVPSHVSEVAQGPLTSGSYEDRNAYLYGNKPD